MTVSTPQETRRKEVSKGLAEAVHKTRLYNGFSQSDLAKHLNRNIATVGRWERGERVPHRSVIAQLLMIAPGDCQFVFEDALGKTTGQLQWEVSKAMANRERPHLEEWDKEPLRYASDIASAIQSRVQRVLIAATRNNLAAGNALIRLLNAAETEAKLLRP